MPMPLPLWTPPHERAASSALARFMVRTGHASYAELHAWSVVEPANFWREVWDFCGMVGEPGEVAFRPGSSILEASFFPLARLSVVENLLQRNDDADALIAIDETGTRRSVTRRELRVQVAAMARSLQARGVVAGDRVAAWLPNGIEAVVTMLAASSIGAVFSSASPDFGVQGVIDRFGQIEPKVLVAAPGYHYNGRWFDCLGRLEQIEQQLPTLRHSLVVGRSWDAALRDGLAATSRGGAAGPPRRAELPRFGFDHPWYVLFSSGTTGVPKCIVHRTGGVLLQHLKEHQLHCDIRPGDRVLYFTTTGWMMFNWLVSVLASGATAVLYDGAPTYPSPERLFEIVDREGVSLLGVSAKYIDSLRKLECKPRRTHDLSSLRTICSTGSPLAPEGFEYVYANVRNDVHLASISGGTDLCGCFAAGDPTAPVYAGELQRPALGMATDVYDDDARSRHETPGVAGELVCTAPFPSMPLGFWADGTAGMPDPAQPGPRYRAAYFERFDNVWTHGDFASWTEHGGLVIHGRSDATLNPGGVRIGTAEIYRVVEQLPEVVESLVFGQQRGADTRIVLLVRLLPDVELTDALRAELRSRIRAATTPRHVPAVIAQVHDLPRTRSNKLVELAVADACNGRPVRNTEALANPEAIAAIVALPELAE